MKKYLVIAAVFASLSSCKSKEEESQDTGGDSLAGQQSNEAAPQLPPKVLVSGQDSASSFTIDSRVAADAIMGQMDEAVNATSSSETAAADGATSLNLAEPVNSRSQTCTEDAAVKSATEVSKMTLLIDRTFSFFGRMTAVKVNASEDRTSKWTKDGEIIACAGKRVKQPANLKGAVMDSTFSRSLERSIASKVAPAKGPLGGILGGLLGDLFQESGSSESKGSRKITWLADDTANNVRTEKHQIESSVTRKSTKKVGQQEMSYETSLKTKDAEPVVVEVARHPGKGSFGLPGIPESKTILSGTLIASRKDGSRIESKFDKIKYEFKKSGCIPVSGKLTGEIFAPTIAAATPTAAPSVTPATTKGADPTPATPAAGAAASKKFTIDFAVQPPVIEFNDGKKEPFMAMGCDFEDLNSAIK